MIYYQYTTTFKDRLGLDSVLVLTMSCEDAEYATDLAKTKQIAKQTMKQANNGTLPTFAETTKTITLTEYNTIIKAPGELEINPDIPIEDEIPN